VKTITRLLLKIACILSLLGIPACSTQTPLPPGPGGVHPERELAERVNGKPELAVLFIGNSYSFGVPKAFSKLATARGKKVRVGHAASGGWTLMRHSTHEPTLRKIRQGNWDVVVIQEQSEIPALPAGKRAAAMFPPLRRLVTEVRRQGAIPTLYQTWGRRDGDAHLKGDTFPAMNARLRAGYQAASKNAGNVIIAPVGDAWERHTPLESLFKEDGSHPSQQGDALTAEVFFQTFFGSPPDNPSATLGSLPQ
jgi:hypothetical protein